MRIVHEEHTDFSAKQMFDIVYDIHCYPAFIPYCTDMQILSVNERNSQIIARMGIGYGPIQEKFDCLVSANFDKSEIKVDYISGSLSDLRVLWRFADLQKQGSRCFFELDYDSLSYFRKKMLDMVVPQIFGNFIHAFKERAAVIYGDSLIG